MRRLVLSLVAILALPALALAADSNPKKQITSADQHKAASIVLKRGDVGPGWARMPATPDEDMTCSFYDPNLSDLMITGVAKGEFQAAGGFPTFLSYAEVYRTRRDAAVAWSRAVKLAFARCLGDALRRDAAVDPNVEVSDVKAVASAFPRLAPRTAAYRLSLRVRAGKTVSYIVDMVFLGRGRAEVGLAAMAPSPGVSARQLRALSTLLAQRMHKAGA